MGFFNWYALNEVLVRGSLRFPFVIVSGIIIGLTAYLRIITCDNVIYDYVLLCVVC